MTFLKRQNYGDNKKISRCQGFGGREELVMEKIGFKGKRCSERQFINNSSFIDEQVNVCNSLFILIL